MQQETIIEHQPLRISSLSLSVNDALKLYNDPRFELLFPSPANPAVYVLRSNGWVGQFWISPELLIRVQPKVPITNLFAMLELAYDLRSFKFLDGIIEIESVEALVERICSILAHRILDRVRRGLHQEYVRLGEDLQVLRGRLDIGETMKAMLRPRPSLVCEFDDLTADLPDNQLLLWTLNVASRMGFQREQVRNEVSRAYRALRGSISLKMYRAGDCVSRPYTRLNADYEAMHGLCRFVLENASPNIESGDKTIIPFSVSMHALFESFVAKWLESNAPYWCKVENQRRLPIETIAGDLKFIVDVALYDKATGRCIAVVDTKYKADEQPSQSDIQQIVAYAIRAGCDRGYLVYPFGARTFTKARIGHVTIELIELDLSGDMQVTSQKMLKIFGREEY